MIDFYRTFRNREVRLMEKAFEEVDSGMTEDHQDIIWENTEGAFGEYMFHTHLLGAICNGRFD